MLLIVSIGSQLFIKVVIVLVVLVVAIEGGTLIWVVMLFVVFSVRVLAVLVTINFTRFAIIHVGHSTIRPIDQLVQIVYKVVIDIVPTVILVLLRRFLSFLHHTTRRRIDVTHLLSLLIALLVFVAL
jgi:hypothetical protein